MIISCSSLRMKNVSDESFRQNQNTLYADFFSFENHFVYEIMWKNMVEPSRPRITIWCMRIVYWIPKATNIHSEYVMLIAFPLHLVSRKRLTHYTHNACLLVMVKYCGPCALQV